jgi:hypothetical protein
MMMMPFNCSYRNKNPRTRTVNVIERGRYAPAIVGRSLSRSLSRGLSSSSTLSAGSDTFAFVSNDDDTGAGNGNGAGH